VKKLTGKYIVIVITKLKGGVLLGDMVKVKIENGTVSQID
jgi:hypothetical protein